MRADSGQPDADLSLSSSVKAVDRLGRLLDCRAGLHGLDAPTKVEATVVQQTQAEAELEALFAAQAALNAATRAAIEAEQPWCTGDERRHPPACCRAAAPST